MIHKLKRISPKKWLRLLPLHTFLLAASPILSLLAFNIDQLYARDALNSLCFSMSITTLVLIATWLLTRNIQLAGLLTSLLVVCFFLYGRLYVPLKALALFGFLIGRHRYLLVAWTGITVVVAFWLVKRHQLYPRLPKYLNLVSVFLICIPTIQIFSFYLGNLKAPTTPAESTVDPIISWSGESSPPDIYYIVLDGYPRSDVLETVFNIDNSPFLDELQQMGFYVAHCAQSNYTRTNLSISSTFNLDYIDTFKADIEPDESPAWLLPYLKQSLVRKQLESLGYQIVVFKNPWEIFLWEDADVVYRSSGPALFSPFEYLLLRTTLARAYLDLQLSESQKFADYDHYEDTRYALEQLPDVPNIPGPKFVFVHLVIPHSPFVFGPDGEYIVIPYDADAGNIYTEEDGLRGFTYALHYINRRMLEILPRILSSDKTPPIIVLAGDHGTPRGGTENAVRILASFYAPQSEPLFYNSITPVNVFRILFNSYFNAEFDLLPDRSYFSAQDQHFNLVEMPNECEVTN